MIYLALLIVLASVSLNIYFLLRKAPAQKHQKSDEFTKFVHDLETIGAGILEIRRINPNDIFLRSPK